MCLGPRNLLGSKLTCKPEFQTLCLLLQELSLPSVLKDSVIADKDA
jgi:hypothetical protein